MVSIYLREKDIPTGLETISPRSPVREKHINEYQILIPL
jgi:hypothetical protein